MCDGDYRQQQEEEEELEQRIMEVLDRVKSGTTTEEDAAFLAIQLRVITRDVVRMKNGRHEFYLGRNE
jgi:hypothetical protein